MKAVILSQLNNQFLQKWYFQVYNNRQCIFYRTFKDTFCFEPYQKIDFLERRALSKIRTGAHKLPMCVLDGFNGDPTVDTACKYCPSIYCDEHHILFECDFFKEKRKIYIKKFYCIKASAFKTNSLFNSSAKCTSNLAKFCKYFLSYFN